MVKKALKRKISSTGEEFDRGEEAGKKTAILDGKKAKNIESSDEVIKEFIKLVNVKQTRLKGLNKFLKAVREAETKCEIILKYLQTHPDCLELFQVLDERIEERLLLEVQRVLEILEIIILYLADEDVRSKSKSTVIITKLFTKHRKLIYNLLNSSCPAKVVTAMLKLLTAIVMQGSSVAKELLTAFDFSHKTFGTLINRRDKKAVTDVRTCFIKFLLSFFIGGDPSLIQQVLQIKGFATSIFKNLHTDSPEVIHLVLSTFLVKVVQNSSLLKKTKILLFTSYALLQLVKLYSYDQDSLSVQDMSVRDRIHHFLLELCTSQGGIAFENKLGMFSPRSNNPVLLRFLHSLPKTLRDELLVELVIKILINSQDLISPYLSDCQMALEPRNSEQWSKNYFFLIKLYFLLPLPSSILENSSVSPDRTPHFKYLLLVCPIIIKRNILTRGLMHSDVVVQTTSLTMVLVILRRAINLTRCVKVVPNILVTFREDILKILPSFQTLISVRESLLGKTKTVNEVRGRDDEGVEKDSSPSISVQEAKLLLSRTLLAMNLYQILSPNSFTQVAYDPWKLLPRSEDEQPLYNLSSEHTMLQVLLNSPSRNFKNNLQSKTESFQGIYQILELYCNTKDASIQSLAREIVKKLLIETGVFDENNEEILLWLRNMLDVSIETKNSVVKFFEKVYCLVANDPFDLVDTVTESVNVLTVGEQYHLAPFKNFSKRAMPFSPLVAGALKLFSHMIRNMDEQVENMTRDLDLVARYLNLVFLDILASQADPSPLCNIVSKYLVEDDLVCRSLPGHTRAFLLYLGQWCPEVKERISNDDGRTSAEKYLWNLKKKQGSLQKRGYLSLSSIQFKEQLPRILEPWISGERSDEFNFLVTYLRCNPVSLFDCLGSAEFVMVLNALPCSLVIQQLLMYVLKYWKSDIADTVALWSTFEQLSVAVLSSVKHENTEHWNQTVPACLFLVHNLIQLYLNDPRNQRVFNEIHRIITEVLRTVLRRIIENRNMEPTQGLSSAASSGSDVRHEHDDVMCAVDDVCELREGLQNQDPFLDCAKMVFADFVFKEWFYCHVDGQKDEAQFAMDYVSSVVSDCVAYLMSGLREEILADKDHELWKPYFLRIANAVKLEAVNKQDVDTDLPFNVGVTSLLKLFCHQIPISSLNETVLAFLDIPQEQFVEDVVPMDTNETSEEQGNRMTVKGKTFVTLLDCFLSKERTGPEISVPVVLERIFQLLIWLDCEETDELTAKSVPVFSSLSDEINVSVLHKCLDHPTPARIQTAVILLSDRPALVNQLEQYLVNHSKGTENETDVHVSTKDEAQFLGVDSQWEAFLPLVNFYLSSVIREDEAPRSQRTQSCVKYIGQVSWPKLKAWLVGTKSVKCANEYFQVVFRLLEVEELDNDALQKLFNDVTKREHSLNWDLFQVQAIESLLQSILKQSSKGKEKKKYRTSFVFACMERLTALLKSHRLQGDDSLRWKILCFLESYGKGPMKFKKIDNFTSEELMNASNAFIKSALRFGFLCAQTLGVLSVIVQSVYECDSKKASLLVPLTDLYQFILSHSKFLEIFLGNAENADCKTSKTKCALIDLLQTVVDLEPKCCNPSHLSLILGAYSAKLGLADQKLLRLLFTYEASVGELATGSRVLWGEAAIEAYQANKDGPATLWHQPSLDQVLDLLDSKLLLQSANHFPIHKQLQPVSAHDGQNSQFYDPSFLLPLFSFFLAPGCEVNCRRFVDRSALAYTISALTSTDKQMRQVAYQILSRFVVHLSGSRFKEQQQVSHLLHCFQNGIMEANSRVSSLITSFMARALHIFFYPEDPLYMSVNSYMLQKAFMDLRDVPLFLSLINSSDLAYRTERTWLVHLLIDGLRDSMDYYICKKYHVFQQLFSLYSCSIADKHLQNLILKVIRQVCRLHAPVYDLCHNYGLVPWLHLLVSNHSTSPDAFQMVLGILGLIWFTLIGEEVSRDDHHTGSRELNRKDESKGHPLPLPKNICPELLLVCLSVLQRDVSLEIWNTDTFVAFARLMESLLNHQNTNPPPTTVVIQKHHATQLTRIWNLIFGDIDILDQLIASFKRDSNFTNNPCVLTTEKWFCSMSSVIHIKNSSQIQELSDNQESNVKLYSCLSRPVSRHVEVFLETKLHRALRGFTEVSDTEGGREGFGDCSSLKRFVDLIFKNSLM